MDENKMPDAATVSPAESVEETVSENTGNELQETGTQPEETNTPAGNAEAPETPAETRKQPTTKAEVIEILKEIVASGAQADRAETEQLKQTYYKIHNTEAAAAREAFKIGRAHV